MKLLILSAAAVSSISFRSSKRDGAHVIIIRHSPFRFADENMLNAWHGSPAPLSPSTRMLIGTSRQPKRKRPRFSRTFLGDRLGARSGIRIVVRKKQHPDTKILPTLKVWPSRVTSGTNSLCESGLPPRRRLPFWHQHPGRPRCIKPQIDRSPIRRMRLERRPLDLRNKADTARSHAHAQGSA